MGSCVPWVKRLVRGCDVGMVGHVDPPCVLSEGFVVYKKV